MRPSLLRLDLYFVEELCFSAQPKYKYVSGEKEIEIQPDDLQVNVIPYHAKENPLDWYFELHINLDDKEGKFPYKFSIKLVGYFEVSEACPPDLVKRLALTNAPSILYSSARELLATVTGRGRHLSVTLPSVSFLPQTETKDTQTIEDKAQPALKGKKATAKRALRKRTSKKKSG